MHKLQALTLKLFFLLSKLCTTTVVQDYTELFIDLVYNFFWTSTVCRLCFPSSCVHNLHLVTQEGLHTLLHQVFQGQGVLQILQAAIAGILVCVPDKQLGSRVDTQNSLMKNFYVRLKSSQIILSLTSFVY